MGNITEILEDYSLNSIQENLLVEPSLLNDINLDIDKNQFEKLLIIEKEYYQKYSGNPHGSFILYIKRIFSLKTETKEFIGDFIFEGRYRLENKGNFEVLGRQDYEEYQESCNIFRNFDKIEKSKVSIYPDLNDFILDEFPKITS